MKPIRCVFGVIAALLLTGVQSAAAQAYPTKPIRLIVPFAPGAANDIIARTTGQKIGESMGQIVVVENRPGAGGSVGAIAVAKAAPDGYTIMLTNPGPGVITPLLARERSYAVADLAPIVEICNAPMVIVAYKDFGPNTPAELLAYAKANPGKIRWGSADAGGIPGLALNLLLLATEIDVLAVPFKGSADSMIAVASGTIDVVYASYASAAAQIAAKRARVIAIAGPKRLSAAPSVATLAEAGIRDAEAVAWFGLAAPRGTPPAILNRINAEVNKALTLADVKTRLGGLELEIAGGSVADFTAVVNKEATRIAALIKAGKLKAE